MDLPMVPSLPPPGFLAAVPGDHPRGDTSLDTSVFLSTACFVMDLLFNFVHL